jgi:hypothetical protein
VVVSKLFVNSFLIDLVIAVVLKLVGLYTIIFLKKKYLTFLILYIYVDKIGRERGDNYMFDSTAQKKTYI